MLTVYEANDGTTFFIRDECKDYEKLLVEESNISELLGYPPLTESHKVHTKEAIQQYRDELSDLCKKAGFRKVLCEDLKTKNNILLRWLSDSPRPEVKVLNRLAFRLQCIDNTGVEWNQPAMACEANMEAGTDKKNQS